MIKTAPFPTTFLQDVRGLWGPRICNVASQTFTETELQKRILMTTRDKKKGKPAFYVDPRTLDHRLNLCFGGSWNIHFRMDQGTHLMVAHANLNINGIVREDVSSEPLLTNGGKPDNMCTTKAQASAFKRAAVKFGITAYMYEFKNEIIWYEIDPKYDKAFKDTKIKLKDLPAFARPIPGSQIVMNELVYLCGSEDPVILKDTLQKFWGLDTVKGMDRDDSIRLASCIARVNDFLAITGKTLEQLAEDRVNAAKSSSSMGFNR